MSDVKKVYPLMPKSVAVWLISNTALTFEQIADFCGLHILEIEAIAEGEAAKNLIGLDPISIGQLTQEEIERCTKNPTESLQLSSTYLKSVNIKPAKRGRITKYTPIARRRDKPDAILWIVKNHPYVPDNIIVKLIGTTKSTIEAIRSRTHWNINELRPRDPVAWGICNQSEIDNLRQYSEAHNNQNTTTQQ